MKNLILLASLFIGSMTFAQGMGDITVYSNTGDKFYVVLNGVRQNDKPQTNVKVTGLTNPFYECKIVSANNNFTIDKNIAVKYDTLITYRVVAKKGKYKLRYYTATPLGTTTSVPDQTVVTYHSTETPGNISTNENVNVNTSTNNTGVSSTTTTTTTSTTSENLGTNTSMNPGNGSESVNMNVGITENGMGVNVNMEVTGTGDPNMNSNSNETFTSNTSTNSTGNNGTYYEESTTTTTTTTSNNGSTYYEESSTTTTTSGNGTGLTSTTTTTTTSSTGSGFTTTNANHTNDGNIYQDQDMTVTMNNCYTSDEEAQGIANQVKNESFSDDQSRIANMAAENKCMTSDQIITIANAFTFEDNKLEFLKKAYDSCTDKSNYYKVMETLTFSGDKEELQQYINAR